MCCGKAFGNGIEKIESPKISVPKSFEGALHFDHAYLGFFSLHVSQYAFCTRLNLFTPRSFHYFCQAVLNDATSEIVTARDQMLNNVDQSMLKKFKIEMTLIT